MQIERVFVVCDDGVCETSLSNWRNLAVGTSERDWGDYEFFTSESDADAAYGRRMLIKTVSSALYDLSPGDLREIAETVKARCRNVSPMDKKPSQESIAGKKPLEAVETPHYYMVFRDLVNRWRSNAARIDAGLETVDAWGRVADDLCELLNALTFGNMSTKALPRDICQRSSGLQSV